MKAGYSYKKGRENKEMTEKAREDAYNRQGSYKEDSRKRNRRVKNDSMKMQGIGMERGKEVVRKMQRTEKEEVRC
jgi:hypothetical protein